MWRMAFEAEWSVWEGRDVTQGSAPTEVFLDFDPVCPQWPGADAAASSAYPAPVAQKGGQDAGQDRD